MSMPEENRDRIRAFVLAKFPKMSLTDDQDIFALGFVNSLFAMELVMFIEKSFGVRIPNSELRLDNFRSVDSMVKLIERLPAEVT
jgi:acyl carrier protein